MRSQLTTLTLLAGLVGLTLPQSIDPSSVDDATKSKWCDDQKSSCPLLCLQIPGASAGTKQNTCDPNTLAFSCVCSNGQQPNASEYSQTVPYYECTTLANQCVDKCATGDSSCQAACRNDHPCGAQSPTRVNTSTISTMTSTSSTHNPTGSVTATGPNGGYTGFGGTGGPTSTGTSDAASVRLKGAALGFGRTFGLVAVLGAVGGAFVFLL